LSSSFIAGAFGVDFVSELAEPDLFAFDSDVGGQFASFFYVSDAATLCEKFEQVIDKNLKMTRRNQGFHAINNVKSSKYKGL
jgi:hypothetical protein